MPVLLGEGSVGRWHSSSSSELSATDLSGLNREPKYAGVIILRAGIPSRLVMFDFTTPFGFTAVNASSV